MVYTNWDFQLNFDWVTQWKFIQLPVRPDLGPKRASRRSVVRSAVILRRRERRPCAQPDHGPLKKAGSACPDHKICSPPQALPMTSSNLELAIGSASYL